MTGRVGVSVIVPIYNMEKLLEQSARSVMNQTFRNLEIILVNDGSSDDSLTVAARLAEEDSRVHVITQDKAGMSAARNTGLAQAGGEWIMFFDPGDSMSPNLIAELKKDTEIEDLDIVACCCTAFTGKSETEDHFFDGHRSYHTQAEKRPLYRQLMDGSYGHPGKVFATIGVSWGKLYRASMLREHDLRFNPELRRYQDSMFNMYAFTCARRIIYRDLPLYHCRAERAERFYGSAQTLGEIIPDGYTIVDVRRSALDELGLAEDASLMDAWRLEALRNLVHILNDGVFARLKDEPLEDQVRRAEEVCALPRFEELLENSEEKNFHGRMMQTLFRLIRDRKYKEYRALLSVKRAFLDPFIDRRTVYRQF